MPSSVGARFGGPGVFRLFLASVVVVHHSFPFRAGSWAVYVFFILSGYWITQMWGSRYSQTRTSYFTFIVSRWWRLAPVFITCSLLGFWSATLLNESELLSKLDLGWWLIQIPMAGSGTVVRVLPPFWSLDVEMQFYLLAPLVILWVTKTSTKARWWVVASLLTLMSGLLWIGFSPELPCFPLFSGFFIAGVILAIGGWVARGSTVVGAIAILVIGLLVLLTLPGTRAGIWCEGGTNVISTNWAAVWWAVAAALVIPFVSQNVRARSSRFDRFAGNLAFPLYAFHWIPRDWYYHFVSPTSSGSTRILLLAANFIFAFAGATLILLLIDQPLERLRVKWVASRRLPLDKRLPAGAILSIGEAREKEIRTDFSS